jgi:hypothetical protein
LTKDGRLFEVSNPYRRQGTVSTSISEYPPIEEEAKISKSKSLFATASRKEEDFNAGLEDTQSLPHLVPTLQVSFIYQ